MALATTRPTLHPKAGVFIVRKAIPRPLAKSLFGVRAEFIENLGTKDEAEARKLAPAALARAEAKLATLRKAQAEAPAVLSEEDAHTLAGLWYREQMDLLGADPGPPKSGTMPLTSCCSRSRRSQTPTIRTAALTCCT